MKQILKKALSTVVLFTIVISLNITAPMASKGSGTVKVPKGGTMVKAESAVTRTRDYSYARAVAKSVYPTGDYTTDNYTKCKAQLFKNGSGTSISDKYTLVEGTAKRLYINEGYMSLTKFDLYFAGNNTNLAAYVVYSYNGL